MCGKDAECLIKAQLDFKDFRVVDVDVVVVIVVANNIASSLCGVHCCQLLVAG